MFWRNCQFAPIFSIFGPSVQFPDPSFLSFGRASLGSSFVLQLPISLTANKTRGVVRVDINNRDEKWPGEILGRKYFMFQDLRIWITKIRAEHYFWSYFQTFKVLLPDIYGFFILILNKNKLQIDLCSRFYKYKLKFFKVVHLFH